MQAIVWTRYGSPDALQLQEIPQPVPNDDQVLIRVHAAGVTKGDCEARSLQFPLFLSLPMRLYMGILKPARHKILGQELAGEVVAAGKNVTQFKVGDAVFGTTGLSFGAYAEYICLPTGAHEVALAHMPANMTYEEAAAVPTGGLEAFQFLRKADLQPGESILIYGAGGSIGTAAVQLAKHFGAEVTAVDSAAKLEMLRALGADHVIDYMREDFTQNGKTYDVIFDVVGKSPFPKGMKSLSENGRYLLANPSFTQRFRGSGTPKRTGKSVITDSSARTSEYLRALKALIEAGKLKSVIDRRYPLAQAADAHRYVETGQKQGNVVLMIG